MSVDSKYLCFGTSVEVSNRRFYEAVYPCLSDCSFIVCILDMQIWKDENILTAL